MDKTSSAVGEAPEILNKIIEKKAEEIPDPNTIYCRACKGNFKKGTNGEASWDTSTRKASDTAGAHGQDPEPKKATQSDQIKTKKKG